MKIPYKVLLLGPTALFALGYLCNVLVMAANHGQMPVLVPGGCLASRDMADDLIHSCMVASTRFKFLADWIVSHTAVSSPGDFLEWLGDKTYMPGLILWIGFIVKDHNKK